MKYYFGYGSNMLKERLEGQKRREQSIGPVIDMGMSLLPNYMIDFSKRSIDGSGKTNLRPSNAGVVYGVLYELTEDQVNLLTQIEVGYEKIEIAVICNGSMTEAITYVAKAEFIQEGLSPTKEYLAFLIAGAKQHNFPINYIANLEKVLCKE